MRVDLLAKVADAMGSTEEQGVFEASVDGLCVIPPRVEVREVRIAGRDRPDVLGAVEAPGPVFLVGMQTDGDDPSTQPAEVADSRYTSGSRRSCRGCDECGNDGAARRASRHGP